MSEPRRIPEGIHQCAQCGEYRGQCRAGDLHHGYSDEDLEGIAPEHARAIREGSDLLKPPDEQIITVSCLCDGIVCPKCKKGRMYRPISNRYDPERNEVWHYPYFYGLRGCDDCAAKRLAAQQETEARLLEAEKEERLERRRQERRRRAALAREPESRWPHIARPLVGRATHGPRLVYGVADYYLIFLDEEEAWSRASLQRVLSLVRTWGELADHVHPDQYAFFVRWWCGEWAPPFYEAKPAEDWCDSEPRPPEPARPRRRRREPQRHSEAFELAGYEGWLSQEAVTYEMRDWIPDEVRGFAEPRWMMGESPWTDCIRLDPSNEAPILAAFEKAGYTCQRDDELVRAATESLGSEDVDPGY